MKLKALLILGLLAFTCQIGYSIYFSIKIVDENTLINQLQSKLNQVEIDRQSIKIQLATINSLETINRYAASKTLVPINSSVNLNQ